jgi:ligand-binding sensor domain-containing protein
MIGAIMMFLMVAFVANSISVARSRIGWSQISSSNSFLPAGAVYRLLPGPEGQMILGTERGLVMWSPPAASDLPDTWVIFNTGNSGLAHNRVLALLREPDGVLWVGTQSGLNRFDGQEWRTFRAEEIGLSGDQIHSLAAGSDGRIWAATSTGAAVYDGTSWQAFTTASGLVHDAVFAVAVEADLNGDRVWFGTLEGVSSYDTSTGNWQSFSRADLSDFGGGIAVFLTDSQGRLWMGSRGGGLYWLDGAIWQVYRTGNSDIPHNTIEAITEYPNGTIWVGVSVPTTVGGVVASLQDGLWTTYSPRNSGYSGGEPISLAFDTNRRLWIGTRTAGVDIYQFAR